MNTRKKLTINGHRYRITGCLEQFSLAIASERVAQIWLNQDMNL